MVRQQVWGLQYIDELIHARANREPLDDPLMDPSDPDHAVQDGIALHSPLFNVLMLINAIPNDPDQGVPLYRHEYTLYGEMQTFISSGPTDLTLTLAVSQMPRITSAVGGVDQPYPLTVASHQGLPYDEATGSIENRARPRRPALGVFPVRDPLGYPDGMNSYAAWHLPIAGTDFSGLEIDPKSLHFIDSSAQNAVASAMTATIPEFQDFKPAADNAPHDPGAFGKAVGAHLDENFDKNICYQPRRFMLDKKLGYFRTGVLINMDTGSLGGFNARGGHGRFVEFDMVFFDHGYNPPDGQKLDPSKVRFYEIKASESGRVRSRQSDRQARALKSIGYTSGVRKIETSHTWSPSKGVVQTRNSNVISTYAKFGAAATAVGVGFSVHAMTSADSDPLFVAAHTSLTKYKEAVANGRREENLKAWRSEAAQNLHAYFSSIGAGNLVTYADLIRRLSED